MKDHSINNSRRQFLKNSGKVGSGFLLTGISGTSLLPGLLTGCSSGGGDNGGGDNGGGGSCSVTGDGTFLFKWGANGGDGTSGNADGEFNVPLSLAVDFNGNVYVSDKNNSRIQKFDADGNFLLTWGSNGIGNGQFRNPSAVAVDSSNNIYVGENNEGGNRIQKFDANGAYISQWDGSLGAGGRFAGPNSIVIDSNDNIFVADTWNYQIQKFDSDGNYITHFGSAGSGDAQFESAKGVAVDGDGNVYAASGDELSENRILKFTSAGIFLGWWGRDDLGMTGWHDPGSGRTATGGIGDGELGTPKGITVDNNNNVYVGVQGAPGARIMKFSSVGDFLGWWGRDDIGNIGWHDPGSGRIAVFGIQDGAFGSERGPRQVAISPMNCQIYITDSGNHRVQVFS